MDLGIEVMQDVVAVIERLLVVRAVDAVVGRPKNILGLVCIHEDVLTPTNKLDNTERQHTPRAGCLTSSAGRHNEAKFFRIHCLCTNGIARLASVCQHSIKSSSDESPSSLCRAHKQEVTYEHG